MIIYHLVRMINRPHDTSLDKGARMLTTEKSRVVRTEDCFRKINQFSIWYFNGLQSKREVDHFLLCPDCRCGALIYGLLHKDKKTPVIIMPIDGKMGPGPYTEVMVTNPDAVFELKLAVSTYNMPIDATSLSLGGACRSNSADRFALDKDREALFSGFHFKSVRLSRRVCKDLEIHHRVIDIITVEGNLDASTRHHNSVFPFGGQLALEFTWNWNSGT